MAYAPISKPIDHNINLLLTAKVNKYINFNIGAIIIYDRDQVSKEDIKLKELNNGIQFNGGANLGFGIQL